MEGVNEYRRQCTAIVQYTVFESTAILYPASPHIIGLYKSFPSLVIDEIKCYKGRGGGGGILPRRETVCRSVDCPGGHCALVQSVRGGGGGD